MRVASTFKYGVPPPGPSSPSPKHNNTRFVVSARHSLYRHYRCVSLFHRHYYSQHEGHRRYPVGTGRCGECPRGARAAGAAVDHQHSLHDHHQDGHQLCSDRDLVPGSQHRRHNGYYRRQHHRLPGHEHAGASTTTSSVYDLGPSPSAGHHQR